MVCASERSLLQELLPRAVGNEGGTRLHTLSWRSFCHVLSGDSKPLPSSVMMASSTGRHAAAPAGSVSTLACSTAMQLLSLSNNERARAELCIVVSTCTRVRRHIV